MKKYSAALMCVAVAVLCAFVHFLSGWAAAVDTATMHNNDFVFSSYLIEWLRDTFENLQSEFWQLAAQFALIAGLFEAWRVKVYEKDIEEVKALFRQHCDEIKALLTVHMQHTEGGEWTDETLSAKDSHQH